MAPSISTPVIPSTPTELLVMQPKGVRPNGIGVRSLLMPEKLGANARRLFEFQL